MFFLTLFCIFLGHNSVFAFLPFCCCGCRCVVSLFLCVFLLVSLCLAGEFYWDKYSPSLCVFLSLFSLFSPVFFNEFNRWKLIFLCACLWIWLFSLGRSGCSFVWASCVRFCLGLVCPETCPTSEPIIVVTIRDQRSISGVVVHFACTC